MEEKEKIPETLEEVVEKSKKGIKKHKEETQSILTKYFKPLHENTGEKWTEENDKDMVKLVELLVNAGSADANVYSSKLIAYLAKEGLLK